ncbi:MAG TPA: hypothetical protein VLI06_05700 [Solimonas sp.]|nr:hypothetical protein [Solimonas sp.]
MAKPNYNFEKRQRELKKAKEQEAKRLKKQAPQTRETDAPSTSDETGSGPTAS